MGFYYSPFGKGSRGDLITALFGVMLVLGMIPGPSVLAVVARSITSGLTHAFGIVIGIVLGDIIFILLAALGLWSIAETAGSLFFLIKYLGAAYLVWLGIAVWLNKPTTTDLKEGKDTSYLSDILCGLLITLADPKVILFYMSFLPAFIDLAKITISDIGIVILTATMAIICSKFIYAYLAAKARSFLKDDRAIKIMNAISSSVMISTAFFLIMKI